MCVRITRKTVKDNDSNRQQKDTTRTKDLQCMKTRALASTTLTLTGSSSVSGHFTHCWVSLCTSCRQFNFVAVASYSILTCARIPCRVSHCGKRSFEVLSLHIHDETEVYKVVSMYPHTELLLQMSVDVR